MFKFISKILIPPLLLSTHLFAQDDLSALLDTYESESALHNTTKDESSGHLVIFSRLDLDKMQADTLNDILKSTRGFNLQQGIKGNIVLQRAAASCASTGCVRIYINDQEMSSAINGSALEIFGEYDLGHVDHIEVYTGGSGIKFGNEYGFITIKIYTKEPKRDKGGFFSTSYGSQDSYGLEAFHAGVSENNLEYLLYAKKSDIDKGTISHSGSSVPRYSENMNVYTTLKKENDFTFELSSYETEHDALAGVGMQKTPEISKVYSKYQYATFTKYFDNLKLQASYAQEQNGIENKDLNGIRLSDKSIINHLNVNFKNSVSKVGFENSYKSENGNLIYGANFQRKEIDLKSGTYTGVDSISIYSGYLEYGYDFNENNLLVATGKYTHYKHQGYERSDSLYEARLGLISLLSENITFKSFFSHNYVYPAIAEMVQFSKPVNGNPDLKPMEINTYSAELVYTKEEHKLGLMFMQMNITDPIQINSQQMYYNMDVRASFNDYAIDYAYTFNKDHKLLVEYYFAKHNRPRTSSPGAGGFVKLFNTFGKFDIYNELIYREGYNFYNRMQIQDGYDWTSSIRYKINREFTVGIKGENLLDKSITSPIVGLFPVETVDKRVTIYATWSY